MAKHGGDEADEARGRRPGTVESKVYCGCPSPPVMMTKFNGVLMSLLTRKLQIQYITDLSSENK